MEYVLQTNALSKRYGRFVALDNLSMHVPKGAIYGFVGKNGAGKTTLIRLICGLQRPSSGVYTLYGVSSEGMADRSKNRWLQGLAVREDRSGLAEARRRMGAVVETPSIYLGMTAEENLRQQCLILGIPSFSEIPAILELVGLSGTGKKKAGNFSLGMRQRLGIAVALVGNPDFLVLDEPVNGLDPQGIIEMRELILRLNRERQITVLISSHILDELSRLATHYGFIDQGRMVKEISAKELAAACRKCICVEVTDMKVLATVLDAWKLEYTVRSETLADIYGKVSVTELAMQLAERGCEIKTMQERDESLESYYIRLVGGESHA